jgi:hypothetical protein
MHYIFSFSTKEKDELGGAPHGLGCGHATIFFQFRKIPHSPNGLAK